MWPLRHTISPDDPFAQPFVKRDVSSLTRLANLSNSGHPATSPARPFSARFHDANDRRSASSHRSVAHVTRANALANAFASLRTHVRVFAPGGIGNIGPGLDISVARSRDPATLLMLNASMIPAYTFSTPATPELPSDPARHTSAIAAAEVLRVANASSVGLALRVQKGLPLAGGQGEAPLPRSRARSRRTPSSDVRSMRTGSSLPRSSPKSASPAAISTTWRPALLGGS